MFILAILTIPSLILLVTVHILNTGQVSVLDIIIFLIVTVGCTSFAIFSDMKQK